ncbi:Amino acid transporter [Arthrobacter sp. cf158]|uniref:APC family permease n=1 Tax=Arthrobacter sp. cf158 TaxID=1761744 RepID=UPI00089B7842|nr:APC family permease [Arthrobacter sp. cf158]SDW91109.1 Amino acid transporter [Arthrobacter sp. cf158]
MVVHTPEPAELKPESSDRLRAGSVGAAGITFFVIAAAAPLTCVIAITPLIIGFGAGISAPLIYLLIGAILLLFAVGYVAMSRRLPNPGALYAYIANGLGPTAGVGAAFVSILAYIASLVTLAAFFGYALSGLLETLIGISLPWYGCCLLAIGAAMALGHREISVGAKVLGILLIAEVSVLLVLAVVVLAQGGARGIEFSAFNPQGLAIAGVGVGLAFAYSSYIGFEQTAIYAEEAKSPHSVRRATFAAIILSSLFYAGITWIVILAFGSDAVVDIAGGSPGTLVFDSTSQYLGSTALTIMEMLVVTSSLATVVSFHNATSRYLYALGRERVLPFWLGRSHHRTQSPYRASILVGVVAASVLGAFALASVDPYLGVFTWGAAGSAVGFIALQAACSLAVLGYFRRRKNLENKWTAVVSPLLAFLGLAGILCLILVNFPLLLGVDVGMVAALVPLSFAAAAIAGVIYGVTLKRSSPAVWESVGAGVRPNDQ